jgi:Cupin domain
VASFARQKGMSGRLLAGVVWMGLSMGSVVAQQSMPGTISPLPSVPFAQDVDVACLQAALETGDWRSGPSTWILKAPTGCVVPWHWHTAQQEQLMVVTGQVTAEMTGHPATLLGPGGFAMMPGRMAHQFTCQGLQACVIFVTFDRAYDIKWGKGGTP